MSTMNNGDSWNDAIIIDRASGVKVTIDTDGKYVEKDIELTINVQPGSASTPNTSITANPTLSVNSSTGVVTANVNATQSVSPTVSPGFVSTGSAGTMTVSGSNTLSLTTQAAQTITPGTANQTIASGKYLTGAQTIVGDANLVAANIAEGITIFGVVGTHSGAQYDTLTVADGDWGIYFWGIADDGAKDQYHVFPGSSINVLHNSMFMVGADEGYKLLRYSSTPSYITVNGYSISANSTTYPYRVYWNDSAKELYYPNIMFSNGDFTITVESTGNVDPE